MTKNQNKAKNMAKKENKGYAIRLTPELSDGLRYISDRTHKTQIGILKEIIEPMIQLAISYEHFTYDVILDRNMIEIIYYGNHGSRMCSGHLTDNDDSAFVKMNKEIETKLINPKAAKASKKLKAMEIVA